jgi:hypothetical protein
MGGLIDGAKKKIWTIANGIVAGGQRRESEIRARGRIATRTMSTSRRCSISPTISTRSFSDLQSFSANGGGDGPGERQSGARRRGEQDRLDARDGATKLVFLVGDAPPHMDYQDDVKYPKTCESAVRKNLIINTVQCGSDGSTTPIWQEIARLSEGSFVALEQSGGMVEVETPMDKEIAELSGKIGALAVPYGCASSNAA